ncbi:ATP-binding cassette domain-containing protein [Verminephrobacter aporrectodeae subsp. tuberculatae]|uniref:ATP-binding cassette domain-containing protein n=2 Tax=Verminephrobacter TaxID=364316 RepID=A0ABT3KSA8_9BURK|nr:ATP-binding cassette domain-containing protein [Verminephrobacter aporrectodeae]MCW5256144.1 ATP-binding cassette domain-containing protein [Verminephrobacter aporrectodeae subsp. tuberculatae]MCW5321193.1 ATP-binding cassette domain-containing protein [Verminephrobacter aporrectodeae subsp. tuberculatae]
MSGGATRPWVELRQVTLRYGHVQALAGVTLRIAPGERVALVGANGSGKSTLLRLLHGLVGAHAGGLQCDAALRQAMLFQRPHMLRTSAQNNVALALWLHGTRWRDARLQALAALQRVELQGVAARNARTLSAGQQQRLALARAWALRPDVLLLDEPTASLDPHAKREVEALLADFAAAAAGAAQPVTMVFSSHNLGQVKRLARRVIYMEHGRLVADLPVHDFFNGPLPEAARLFVKGELV